METTRILKAARENKLQRVKFLIEKKGVPANVTNERQKTIAHIAVRNDNLDMLDYILNKDPSLLTKTDNHESTILQLAVERGTLDIVKYLVEKRGANVFDKHVRDYNITGTAVHRAIKYGHENILRYFIEGRKVDVDEPVTNQVEPLLWLAMRLQKMEIVKYLIEVAKAKLTVLNSNGENILFLAIEKGNFNFIKDSLNRSEGVIDINWKRVDGKTLTHIAVIKKQMETLKYLVEERNADVNVADNDENTPLHYAVFNKEESENSYEYFKYLIMHDADMNKKNKDGYTSLSLLYNTHFITLPFDALYKNDLAFFKYLLDRKDFKFDVKRERFGDKTLLETAYEFKEMDMMSYLVKEKHAADSPTWLNNKLLESAGKWDTSICKNLIELGADVKQVDQNGNTILHIAASKPYRDGWYEYLIDHGCDVNKKNMQGNTPLHLTITHVGRLETCQYFIKRGSNINQKNNEGETPLHLAISSGQQKISEYLIEQGADIDQKNCRSETSLHLAASRGHDKICEYLIKKGANVHEMNNQRETPLHLAVSKGHDKICEYLIKNGANVNEKNNQNETPLHYAASQGQKKICESLIKKGANINKKNKRNERPIHLALFNNHEEIFTYLADRGAIIDDVIDKTTSTHIAAEKNQMIALNYLITKKNADVNVVRNGDNWTPLHCAAFGKHKEIFQYLIEHGANIEAKDVHGKTPLQVVNDRRFVESIEGILKTRSRRSVGKFFRPLSYSSGNLIPKYCNQLRITGNVDQNLSTLSSTHVPPFQNFLTIFCSIVRNFHNPIHAASTEETVAFSRVNRHYRMNSVIETAIMSLPDFEE